MATFGKTTIGGTSNVQWPGDANTVSVCQFNLPDNNALISKLTTYSSTLSTASEYRGVIYNDSSNTPSSVIATTLPASVLANQFINLPFQSSPTLNSGNYWLGIIANGAGLTTSDVAGLNRIAAAQSAYPNSATTPFPGGASSIASVNQKTIYATYTVTATGWNIALV